jgi:hypothetical protein
MPSECRIPSIFGRRPRSSSDRRAGPAWRYPRDGSCLPVRRPQPLSRCPLRSPQRPSSHCPWSPAWPPFSQAIRISRSKPDPRRHCPWQRTQPCPWSSPLPMSSPLPTPCAQRSYSALRLPWQRSSHQPSHWPWPWRVPERGHPHLCLRGEFAVEGEFRWLDVIFGKSTNGHDVLFCLISGLLDLAERRPGHLPEHDVERAERGRHIGQLVAAADEIHRLQVRKPGARILQR